MAKPIRQKAEELAFVLIGALGSGKSSTGNAILGRKEFKVTVGTVAVTTDVEMATGHRDNLTITVIDTPGLQYASSFPTLKAKIQEKLRRSRAEKVVYVITILIGRYTKEEKQLLEDIFKKNKELLKNAIIIFTNRNELLEEDNPVDQILDTWIQKNPSLLKLIDDNKLKYLAFENKRQLEAENDAQVKDLISTVSSVETSEGICPEWCSLM